MTIPASVLSVDFETASRADLKKTGAAVYARDPSTRILCMAWAFDNEPVAVWVPGVQAFPDRIARHVRAGGIVRGWNISFEFWIWNYILTPGFSVPPILPNQLRDTMAQAAYWGLPMSLDAASQASGLGAVKDKDGHKLMLQMCKPRRDGTWWHEADPVRYQRLQVYCASDVEAERMIASKLPPLPADEQSAWELDFDINQRGVKVDLTLVNKLIAIAQSAAVRLNAELYRLTGTIRSTNATGALLTWLQAHGYPYRDLKKATVAQRLREPDVGVLEGAVLRLRREAAKASTAKLRRLQYCVGADDRIRGMLQFYGASRTGRWAGRLFQPQNLPRPTIKRVDLAIKLVLDGENVSDDVLEIFFEDSALGAVASMIRGCLVAKDGHTFAVPDFSQIEARVVAWLAGQDDILDVFRRGEDVYTYTAAKVGSSDRQLGKVLVLACGFGMGWPKFQGTAKGYGMDLSDEFAEDSVRAWRQANPKIVSFWYDCDDAARQIAAGQHGDRIQVRDVAFIRVKNSMLIRLPSGRHLVYRDIKLEFDPDTGRATITYLGQDPITKKWGRVRTYGGKIVENITQAVARDILRDAMVAMHRRGIPIVLTIHDEVLAEVLTNDAQAMLDLMLQIMSVPPAWAPGLPVGAAGWIGPRYKKG